MQKKKILVIEDEEILQEMVKDFLSISGFDVCVASDGEEGLRLIYEELPDLVLLDCQMPKMDGYEVLSRIRKDPLLVNLPVIMLTVKSSESDQLKGIQLGADDYIIKPYNRNVLVAKIRTLLERKELSLSTNPLTQLPGSFYIQKEVQHRIQNNKPFVIFYLDLDNFKSFNDYYGFHKGDEVIKFVANILVNVVKQYVPQEGIVGHIGGDDFVVVLPVENYKTVAEKIIEIFDRDIKKFYSEEDLRRGYIETENRQGQLQKFPIMTISIVGINSVRTKITHYAQISQICAELKKYAKQFNKSIFVEERRTQ